MAAGEKTIWHGDEAEYTGKSQFLHGARCYELLLLEGHRKDELVWTYQPPVGE